MATPPPAAEQSPGARLPSPVEWTSNRSATRPDPLHPMHRHDVGRARAPDRTELEHVAIAMRRGCRISPESGEQARFAATDCLEPLLEALRTARTAWAICSPARPPTYATASGECKSGAMRGNEAPVG